ncbi:condensation domain-containing protein, partial [Streptomyces sp. NPDC056437]|uniref:condensation domain-containing protein n=1 Tax=Streptomyces sp. NPDC056437 TaxID=3345816 RepID=UPI00368FD45D
MTAARAAGPSTVHPARGAAAGLPLTAAQQGMWFAQAIDPQSPALNTAEYVVLDGDLRPELLVQALRQTAAEAEALCVRIVETSDGPRQFPVDPASGGTGFPLHSADLRGEADSQAAAQAWMDDDVARPFNLAAGPPFRHGLLRVGDRQWFWYQCVHHMVLDGFGYSLLSRRVANVYEALTAGTEPAKRTFGRLTELIEDDAAYRASDRFTADRTHWTEALADRPQAPMLAGRSVLASHTFLRRGTTVRPAITARLRELAEDLRATWPEVLIAVQALYVSRVTGTSDVVLGMPMMGRLGSVALRIPGMVMNVLPLRLAVTAETTLAGLTRQVVLAVRSARRHQRYRIEDIRRDHGLLGEGRAPVGPLVNIMPFDHPLSFGDVSATSYNLSAGPVDDLTMNVYDRSDKRGLRIDHDANPALYSADALASHQERFLDLLTRAVETDPAAPLTALSIATAEERRRVLIDFNDTECRLPTTSLAAPIEEQARRTPTAPAIVFDEQTLTYAQLDARAGRLASRLVSSGVRPGALVAVALPRSAELVVALLAVLKAGGAYLPLDPGHPPGRIAAMLGDAAPVCLLTDAATLPHLPDTDAATLLVDDTDAPQPPPSGTPDELTPQHPAYVIYTSGSTGRPKGVVVS